MKQVKLQKNNNAVLNMMIGDDNGTDISLSKEDFDIALEHSENFFTLQTSYEEFEVAIKAIKSELSHAENIIISFEYDGIDFDIIQKCVELEVINEIALNDKVLKFGTKRLNELSRFPIIIFFSVIN